MEIKFKSISLYSIVLVFLSFFNGYGQQIIEESTADTIPLYSMSEIVVIGERSPSINSDFIYELSANQINRLDVRQADQALSTTPGLYFSKNSKNESKFILNGFDQRQVNVFLDGVPVSVAFDGMIDLSQFSGDNIESIRISRGLPSVLYGANTLGGSINIITNTPVSDNKFDVRTEVSNHKRFFGRLGINLDVGKLLINGFAVLNQASEYRLSNKFKNLRNENGPVRENSDFKKISMGTKLYYNFNPSNRIGFNLNVIRNEMGIPPNASVERPRYWRFPRWDKNVISLNSEHQMGSTYLLRSILFLDQSKNRLESFDDNTYSSQTKGYAFTSEYDDYAIGAAFYHHIDLFSFGLTEGVISFKQDVHEERSDQSHDFEKYATNLFQIGIEQDIKLTNWLTVAGGIDVEHLQPKVASKYTLRDPITLLNGQSSMFTNLNQKLDVFAAIGIKSRFPTLKELYSEYLGRTIANPNLVAERSHNIHTGITWKHMDNSLTLSAFYNQVYNLITLAQLGDNTQQYRNTGKALLQGFNFNSEICIGKSIIDIYYSYLVAKNVSADRSSDFLEYRPKHRINILWIYPILSKFTIQTELSHTRNQFFQNPDNAQWQKLNDFSMVNLKFEYLFLNNFKWYLRIDNILDENYVSEYGIPMPGRVLSLGLKIGL